MNYIVQAHKALLIYNPSKEQCEINQLTVDYLRNRISSYSKIYIVDNVPEVEIFTMSSEMVESKYLKLKNDLAVLLDIPSSNIKIYKESVMTSYSYLPLPGLLERILMETMVARDKDILVIAGDSLLMQAADSLSLEVVDCTDLKSDDTYSDVITRGLRTLQDSIKKEETFYNEVDFSLAMSNPIIGTNFVMY